MDLIMNNSSVVLKEHNVQVANQMSINTSSAKSFLALTQGLYSNVFSSILRELVSNGIDASVLSGTKIPLIVNIPSNFKFEPFFVQDFGIGMSLEDVFEIYCNYFKSNKSNDSNAIGGFGLGGKTPFTYTNEFKIETTSHEDNVRRTFIIKLNDDSKPIYIYDNDFDIVDSKIKGTKISFFIKNNDDLKNFVDNASFLYYSHYPIVFKDSHNERLIEKDKVSFVYTNNFLARVNSCGISTVPNKSYSVFNNSISNQNGNKLVIFNSHYFYDYSVLIDLHKQPELLSKLSKFDFLQSFHDAILLEYNDLLLDKLFKQRQNNLILLDVTNDKNVHYSLSRENIEVSNHNSSYLLNLLSNRLDNGIQIYLDKISDIYNNKNVAFLNKLLLPNILLKMNFDNDIVDLFKEKSNEYLNNFINSIEYISCPRYKQYSIYHNKDIEYEKGYMGEKIGNKFDYFVSKFFSSCPFNPSKAKYPSALYEYTKEEFINYLNCIKKIFDEYDCHNINYYLRFYNDNSNFIKYDGDIKNISKSISDYKPTNVYFIFKLKDGIDENKLNLNSISLNEVEVNRTKNVRQESILFDFTTSSLHSDKFLINDEIVLREKIKNNNIIVIPNKLEVNSKDMEELFISYLLSDIHLLSRKFLKNLSDFTHKIENTLTYFSNENDISYVFTTNEIYLNLISDGLIKPKIVEQFKTKSINLIHKYIKLLIDISKDIKNESLISYFLNNISNNYNYGDFRINDLWTYLERNHNIKFNDRAISLCLERKSFYDLNTQLSNWDSYFVEEQKNKMYKFISKSMPSEISSLKFINEHLIAFFDLNNFENINYDESEIDTMLENLNSDKFVKEFEKLILLYKMISSVENLNSYVSSNKNLFRIINCNNDLFYNNVFRTFNYDISYYLSVICNEYLYCLYENKKVKSKNEIFEYTLLNYLHNM